MERNMIPVPNLRGRPLALRMVGAHRGGREALPYALDFNDRAGRPIDITVIDAHRGRAPALADTMKKRGVDARAIEAHVEDPGVLGRGSVDLNLIHLDRPRSIDMVLGESEERGEPAAGLLNMQVPRLGLVSLAFLFEAGSPMVGPTRRLMRTLDRIASREGSAAVFGADAPTDNRFLEPHLRRWYGGHLASSLGKLASGLPASAASSVLATLDAKVTRPVAILDGEVLENDSNLVAERLLDERPFAMRRHLAFLVIELAASPEPVMRARQGFVRGDGSIQIGRARDLSESAFDEVRAVRARRVARAKRPALDVVDGIGTAIGVSVLAGLLVAD